MQESVKLWKSWSNKHSPLQFHYHYILEANTWCLFKDAKTPYLDF